MKINLFDFEKNWTKKSSIQEDVIDDEKINEKYIKGEARIITEQGSIKLPLINNLFIGNTDNKKDKEYELRPKYQRRITWNDEKRSKLIESFIMNIPIPPIFLYETEYGKYQVMDGLQRISAISDFYSDKFSLKGLIEWKELNGRKYSDLPEKIKEGIDRRQISVTTLLKESTKDHIQEQNMKKMVFERLNTGGVTLKEQEIRNALYPGLFNDLCIKLSSNSSFKKLWRIPNFDTFKNSDEFKDNEILDEYEDIDTLDELSKNRLYMRMFDVELILRFFAIRFIDDFHSGLLSEFLDSCLKNGNLYNKEQINTMEELFEKTIEKAEILFGEKAFCKYIKTKKENNFKWSTPQKMVYDALMIVLTNYKIDKTKVKLENNITLLEREYQKSLKIFDGKGKQTKNNTLKRIDFFEKILKQLDGVSL